MGHIRHTYKCDVCKKDCNLGDCGNSISVWFPYGHALDGSHGRVLDSTHEFCSSECLINYIVSNETSLENVQYDENKEKGDDNYGSNI